MTAADERLHRQRAAAAGPHGRARTARSSTPTRRPRPSSTCRCGSCSASGSTDIVPFGSPVLGLIDQVRAARRERQRIPRRPRQAAHSAASASSTSSRRRSARTSDVVVLMLQERTIADKMDRQLTHRGAARSVTALGAMLAHEIKNPLSGIRGAAQLLEQSADEDDRLLTRLICDEADRIVRLVDRMELFGDERPVEREPVNIHGVLDHVKRLAQSGFARHIRFVENYDPSLPPVMRQPRPARPGLPQPREERRRGDRRRCVRTARSCSRPPSAPASGCSSGLARARQPADRDDACATTAPACRSTSCPTCSTRSSPPRRREVASDLPWWPRSSATMAGSSNATPRRAAPRSASSCRCTAPATGATPTSRADRSRLIHAERTYPRRRRRRRHPHRAQPGAFARRLRGALDLNAATLWRWVAQGEGDLVITDVVMPDENAFDLLPRIKRVRPELPIIVMSAQNTFMTAIRASERGAYEYLPKPFDLKELIAIVGRALSRPRGAPHAERRRREGEDDPARRPLARDAGDLPGARPADADRPHGDDHGRVRHRQGAGRARAARLRQAPQRPVRRRQHGGDPARADRIGAVRA